VADSNIGARPDRASEAELDLILRHIGLERLDRCVVAAGLVADRYWLARLIVTRAYDDADQTSGASL
jgi:hypothetical protein